MYKNIEIKLRHKATNKIVTYYCHCFSGNSTCYHLQGVKGFKDPLNIGLCFNKMEWERVK